MLAPRRVSIVVTVYNRRGFYVAAVESALRAADGRENVEVILLKNFVEPEVDSRLEKLGVRLAVYSSPKVGASLRRAIELCEGEYIFFLDDDDLFKSSKLERFETILSKCPGLGYYHNGYEISLESRAGLGAWERLTLARRHVPRGAKAVHPFSGPEDPKLYRFLAKKNWEQNLSSTTVRRDIAFQSMEMIGSMSAMTDTIMLTVGLTSDAPLVFDEDIQTVVRRHTENSSNRYQHVELRLEELRKLGKICSESGAPELARRYFEMRAAREVIYFTLMGGKCSPDMVFDASIASARSYVRRRAVRDAAYAVLGAIECVLPPLVPRLRPLAVESVNA